MYRQNQFGGTFGGPIFKNRTFFFLSYEGIHSNEQSAGLSYVLTPNEINGDFSSLCSAYAAGVCTDPNGTQLYSPYTGAPYNNNQVPVDTTAQNIVKKYMPLPNTNQSGGNFAYYSGGYESTNQYIARVDDTLNANNQLMVHFMYAKRASLISEGNPNFNDNESLPI